MDQDKYYRYQMTYPYESTKIYKSKNFDKVVNKCYNNYNQYNNIENGMFCITNLDKNIEYKFKVTKNKIDKIDQNIIQEADNSKLNQHSLSSNDSEIFSSISSEDFTKKENNCIIV